MRSLVIGIALAIVGCGGSYGPPDGGDIDMLGAGDAALAPFGAVCTMNAQCASSVCFVGGNRSFCSMRCTSATQATDCPVPPTSGTCNMQGYCKP